MAVNFVTLTGNLGPGTSGAGTVLTFTRMNGAQGSQKPTWIIDSLNHFLLPPTPVTIHADAAGSFSDPLYATDSTSLAPPGGGSWFWHVDITNVDGAVNLYSFEFNLLFSNGSTQDISGLTHINGT